METTNKSGTPGTAYVCALSALAAVIAAVGSLIVLRYGIRVETDSWSYWQASVSLLQGRGYNYFNGLNVRMWPPGYPLYLAAWQHFRGISGRTLALANVALSAPASLLWTLCFLLPYRAMLGRAGASRITGWAVALLIPAFVAFTMIAFDRVLMSQNLSYMIYPAVLYMSYQVIRPNLTARTAIGYALLNGILLTTLLMTHNSFIAFMPILSLLILWKSDQKLGSRFLLIGLTVVIPSLIWRGVLIWLHQTKGHQFGGPRAYTWSQYAHQVYFGTAALFGPPKLHLNYLLLIAVCGMLVVLLAATRQKNATRSVRPVITYLQLSCGFLCVLYVIFNTTWIYDALSTDRFILFMPLTLFPAAVILFMEWRQRAGGASMNQPAASELSIFAQLRPLAPLFLVVLILIPGLAFWRVVHWSRVAKVNAGKVDLARIQNDEGFAYNRVTIDSEYFDLPPMRLGHMILRSPGHIGDGRVQPKRSRPLSFDATGTPILGPGHEGQLKRN